MFTLPCSTDITIDTCVLAHACNGAIAEHASAVALLAAMDAHADIEWVLDDNGKSAPDVSTSVLYSEYMSTLPPHSLPLMLLVRFFSFGRVHFAPRPGEVRRKVIRRLVPRNRRDQVVLGAASMSRDGVLVTNDFNDFTAEVRDKSEAEVNVRILASSELYA